MWFDKGSVKDQGNIIFIVLSRRLERMRSFTQDMATWQDGSVAGETSLHLSVGNFGWLLTSVYWLIGWKCDDGFAIRHYCLV